MSTLSKNFPQYKHLNLSGVPPHNSRVHPKGFAGCQLPIEDWRLKTADCRLPIKNTVNLKNPAVNLFSAFFS
jgi:hypothetical protein